MAKKNPNNILSSIVYEAREHNAILKEHTGRLNGIEKDIVAIKTDVSWLREGFRKIDARLWGLVIGIIVTILMVVLTRLL